MQLYFLKKKRLHFIDWITKSMLTIIVPIFPIYVVSYLLDDKLYIKLHRYGHVIFGRLLLFEDSICKLNCLRIQIQSICLYWRKFIISSVFQQLINIFTHIIIKEQFNACSLTSCHRKICKYAILFVFVSGVSFKAFAFWVIP